MEIKGQVYCFFEQSGTFKNAFRELGYAAFDYDIENGFGETDFTVDLFGEIQKAYCGNKSVFDNITADDLIIAFFPCIYFCEKSMWAFKYSYINYRKLTNAEKIEKIIERENNRHCFYLTLLEFVAVCERRGLRMIFENPETEPHYLTNNFPISPQVVDMNRSLRGDFRKKPTKYYFFNCEPTRGNTYQPVAKDKVMAHNNIRGSRFAGKCGIERSVISSAYSVNFIRDYVLGEKIKVCTGLFDEGN